MGALGSVIVGVQLRESPPIVAVPLALAAGMLAGAAWGFIPGFLKAVSRGPRGRHDDHAQLHRDRDPRRRGQRPAERARLAPRRSRSLSATRRCRSSSAGTATLGIIIAPLMAVLYGFLLFRTTRGFEIRTAGANPNAARYAGMSPRRLIIWTMSLSGLLAGLAGATELLGDDPPR